MKNLILFLCISCVALLASCQESDQQVTEIPCEGECLFTLTNIEGTMINMACFDTYGIMIPYPADSDIKNIFIIPDNLEKVFEVGDKKVIVNGICRTNILEPLLPDPAFNMNALFQAEIIDLKSAP